MLQRRSGRCGEEKSLPLQETGLSARSLITILTEAAAAVVVVVVVVAAAAVLVVVVVVVVVKVVATVNLVVDVVVVTVITENTDAVFLCLFIKPHTYGQSRYSPIDS